ncbi:flagellar export chaperone FliS [Paenibacillus sp. FSL K6-1566]|uniref:flagellar export chaperone FliS n=1 Tax=Paenibacillus TaxID=44249 RepID=UPI0020407922|nr:flagellar export chaperone FliS [Paenibacillus lactis]MCM3493473.1 flagellar export chaperone FliS [Paenibacillus lactis]
MVGSNYHQYYQKTKVGTASPGDLTLLLYEEFCKKLNMARVCFLKQETDQMLERIHGARAIIYEFIATLNFKYDLANQLNQLYQYYLSRLNDFILYKQIEILDEVIEFGKGFTETWRQALLIVKKDATV